MSRDIKDTLDLPCVSSQKEIWLFHFTSTRSYWVIWKYKVDCPAWTICDNKINAKDNLEVLVK